MVISDEDDTSPSEQAGEDDENLTKADYQAMKVLALRAMCRNKNLKQTGLKDMLISRLMGEDPFERAPFKPPATEPADQPPELPAPPDQAGPMMPVPPALPEQSLVNEDSSPAAKRQRLRSDTPDQLLADDPVTQQLIEASEEFLMLENDQREIARIDAEIDAEARFYAEPERAEFERELANFPVLSAATPSEPPNQADQPPEPLARDALLDRVAHFREGLPDYPDSELHAACLDCVWELARRGGFTSPMDKNHKRLWDTIAFLDIAAGIPAGD
jgi:hypothetical protein